MTLKTKLILAMTAFSFVCASAQPKIGLKPDETVLFYAEKYTGTVDPVVAQKITSAGYEMKTSNKCSGEEKILESGNMSNISEFARMDLYFPENPNGQMIIVCPGGGYAIVSSYNEGLYVADSMIKEGITVAVVKYRLPNGQMTVPQEDVECAFRYCRAHAAEWGVNQIGIMGFSAGGHLAATVSTSWTCEEARPDFSVLFYPVITMEQRYTHKGTRENLLTAGAGWKDHRLEKYSLEEQVTRFTPPTFLALCSDDFTVPAENSLKYYNELINNDVPAEMHIWPRGGHGWGFSKKEYVGSDRVEYARNELETSLYRWLSELRK